MKYAAKGVSLTFSERLIKPPHRCSYGRDQLPAHAWLRFTRLGEQSRSAGAILSFQGHTQLANHPHPDLQMDLRIRYNLKGAGRIRALGNQLHDQ